MSLLGVSEEEFAIITDACVEATTKLRNNHEEAVRCFDAERGVGRLPSKEERAAFEGKRVGILQEALAKLRRRLPAKAWNSVSSFIHIEMRSGLVSKPLPAEK